MEHIPPRNILVMFATTYPAIRWVVNRVVTVYELVDTSDAGTMLQTKHYDPTDVRFK